MDQWIKLRRKIHNKDQAVSLRQLERDIPTEFEAVVNWKEKPTIISHSYGSLAD